MPPKRPAYIEEIDELADINPHLSINSSNRSTSKDDENVNMKDIKPIIDRSTQSPKKKAKSSTVTPKTTPKKSTPNSSPSKTGPVVGGSSNGNGSLSAKARFAEIIIENGLRGYDRNLVESETGLTKNQQIEMLKKGRGSLWIALYGFASTV